VGVSPTTRNGPRPTVLQSNGEKEKRLTRGERFHQTFYHFLELQNCDAASGLPGRELGKERKKLREKYRTLGGGSHGRDMSFRLIRSISCDLLALRGGRKKGGEGTEGDENPPKKQSSRSLRGANKNPFLSKTTRESVDQ